MIICQDFIDQEFHNMNEDQAVQLYLYVMYITIKVRNSNSDLFIQIIFI